MKLGFCVACGKTADLHHIRFTPRGGDDDSNLITLCRSCSYKRWHTKADLIAQAQERAEALRPILAELAGLSSHAIAAELNRRGVPTPHGGSWHSTTVIRVLNRLKD